MSRTPGSGCRRRTDRRLQLQDIPAIDAPFHPIDAVPDTRTGRLRFAPPGGAGLVVIRGRAGESIEPVLLLEMEFRDAYGTTRMRSEWFVASDAAFEMRVHIPRWCREIGCGVVDAPAARLEFRTLQALGWIASMIFVLRRALRPLRAQAGRAARSFARRMPRERNDAGVSGDAAGYRRYLRRVEPRASAAPLEVGASFALFLVGRSVDGTVAIAESLASLRNQVWQNWTLTLILADPAPPELVAAAEGDDRIRVVQGSAERAIGEGLAGSVAGYAGFLDGGDRLHPLALRLFAECIDTNAELELLYSDEDQADFGGARHSPRFKPDWNPDWLWARDYIGNLAVISVSRVLACGGWRARFGSAARYDLLLRATQDLDPSRIRHVPWVLCHRSHDPESSPDYAAVARAALEDRVGERGAVMAGLIPGSFRVRRPLAVPPTVSVIVPTRDGGEHLKVCIDSLRARTAYPGYELIIVDNQSRDPDTLAFLDELRRQPATEVLLHDAAFNFSAIVNRAVAWSRGSIVVLLNDDTEVRSAEWLEELVGLASQPDVGAVGAKLYYPDGSIQHAGIALGIGGVAAHLHLGAGADAEGYLGQLRVPRAVAAVTAACLAVRRDRFDAVGGMDERWLAVALNDVDLCLKLASRGWRSLWTPYAELTHHESKTRGADDTPAKRVLFQREHAFMRVRWRNVLGRDPYYHPHLTRSGLDLGFNEKAEFSSPGGQAVAHADVCVAIELPA